MFFIIGIILLIKGEFRYKNNEKILVNNDINNIIFNDIMSKILLCLFVIFLVGLLIGKNKIYDLNNRYTQISNGSIELMHIDENLKDNNIKDNIKFMYDNKVMFYFKKIEMIEDVLYIDFSIENNTEDVIRCNPYKFFIQDDMENKYYLDILKNIQFKNELLPKKKNEIRISTKQLNETAKNVTLNFYIDCENKLITDENDGYLSIKFNIDNLK